MVKNEYRSVTISLCNMYFTLSIYMSLCKAVGLRKVTEIYSFSKM